jgi:hypothetical protein
MRMKRGKRSSIRARTKMRRNTPKRIWKTKKIIQSTLLLSSKMHRRCNTSRK